jgi:CRISPR-associated protein Cas6
VEPIVDVAFPIRGRSVPLDHGYALFGALSRVVPRLHKEPGWGVHPIYGRRAGPGILSLMRQSQVTLRLPAAAIGDVLTLSDRSLDIDGHEVRTGVPRIFALHATPTVRARYVTIKKFNGEPGEFKLAAVRQLEALGATGSGAQVVVGERRVMKVGAQTIVGFSVELTSLSPDLSLEVQRVGIGGRRHMGAGVFLKDVGHADV